MARILIAEDERDIRDLITFTLRFVAQHEVIPTTNGKELVDTLHTLDPLPDLIMTDVRMPQMTGYEACKLIREESRYNHIPVVILSAKGQESEVQTGIASGATEYIIKPFAPDQLVMRVQEILAKYAR